MKSEYENYETVGNMLENNLCVCRTCGSVYRFDILKDYCHDRNRNKQRIICPTCKNKLWEER